ncbi:MAG: glutathione S-transferase family protein [Alphaproteobacteria bacterium]|nr:glutathione S-transferase family protein [Alphaproteobacteria bacterium]
MKLYQTNLSPFPTRVRLLLYAKNIAMEIVEPSGIHDAQPKGSYLDINPLGRVPALQLDDGRVLPESEVICEYLEDTFPEPSLRPKDAWSLAQVRLLSRLCDFYLVMAMVPLFTASAQKRKDWNHSRIGSALDEVDKALGYIEHYIGSEGYAVGRSLTHADGALIPQLVLAFEWAPKLFERTSPQTRFPKLDAYFGAIQKDPIAARLIGETRDAIAAAQKR